jgi:gliding motility-associated lipoprotein GldH
MRNIFLNLFGCSFLVFVSCSGNVIYSESEVIPKGQWDRNQVLQFTLKNADTVSKHNLHVVMRNDNTYPYSNLFLIVGMQMPSGLEVRDTLEYVMADAQGKWLGSGATNTIENILGYKQNVVFSENGVYTFTISHAMRENGNVKGIDSLPGVLDVGIHIEKNAEK